MSENQKTIADGCVIVANEFYRKRMWFAKTFLLFFGVIFGGLAVTWAFPVTYSAVALVLDIFVAVFCLYIMWISGLLRVDVQSEGERE